MAQFPHANTTSAITGVGTNFLTSKVASLNVSHSTSPYFCCRIESIKLQLNTIVTATNVTVKVTNDSDGDHILIEDTTATIANGITTAASGSITINTNCVVYSQTETFYVFPKVNAGSCNVSEVTITYNTKRG